MELGLTLGGGDSVSASSVPLKTSASLALSLGVNSSEIRSNHQEPLRSDDNPTASMDSSHDRLDLFPLWSPPEITKTESLEMGLSGAAVRRLDANLPLAVEEVEAVSSPKSVASTLQVDFGGERKRESAEGQASDEDENSLNRKKLRLSKGQAAFLEETFKEHNTLNPKQKQALAKQLNLRPRQVEVWFQNRRARTKLKQTEVDCEYLKRYCETLTTENRRLHKELQELRALKSSNPFSTREPATTLTMCPSCERTTSTTNTATSSASAVTTAVSMNIAKPTSRSVPFPLSRPKFFPYSSHSNPPQKSLAS